MGLETAAPGLGRIDVNQITGGVPAPVVEPRAVAALTEAFRNGQITANDIHDRFLKAPVVEAQAKLMADPAIVEAQRRNILAGADQNELQVKELEQKLAFAKIPPSVRDAQTELIKAGYGVEVDPQSWTPKDTNEVLKRYSELTSFKDNLAKSALDSSVIKDDVRDTKHQGRNVKVAYKVRKDTNEILDPKQVGQIFNWQQTNPSVKDWVNNGKPQYQSIFADTAPGTVAPAGSAPAAGPAASPLVVPAGKPGGVKMPATGSAAAVAAASPATPMAGGASPNGGDDIQFGTIVEDKQDSSKGATQVQGQSGTFVAKAREANDEFAKLKAVGFNPASWSSWFQDFAVGPLGALKTEEKRKYDAAQSAWISGLLRLESGAAISAKEQSWYERTFFPQLGDTGPVQAQKERMRAGVEAVANTIAQQGGVDADSILQLNGVLNQANSISPATTASKEQVVKLSDGTSVRTIQVVDPTTGATKRRILGPATGGTAPATNAPAAKAASADSYQAPSTLGGTPAASKPKTVSVEPREQKSPTPSQDEERNLVQAFRKAARKTNSP